MFKLKLISRFAPSLTGDLHLGNLFSIVLNTKLVENTIWRIDGDITIKKNFEIFRKQLYILKDRFPFKKYSVLIQKRNFWAKEIKFLIENKILYKDVSEKFKGCFRLKLPIYIEWKEITGIFRKISLRNWVDPIVITSDNRLLYSLASALWDIRNKIDIVIRGNDLISSTVLQMIIFKTFNKNIELFHHPLLLLEEKKLSKKSSIFFSLENLLSIYPLEILESWIHEHILRKHDEELTFKNISEVNKLIKETEFIIWCKKRFKKSQYEWLSSYFLKIKPDDKILKSLITVSSSIPELKSKYLNFNNKDNKVSIDPKDINITLKVLRLIIWNNEVSPSFKEAIEIIPQKILNKKLKLLINIKNANI